MKRWISLFLCLCMTMCFAVPAMAEMKDGDYTAKGAGNNGDVTVAVTIAGGKIASVEVTDHAETAGISDPAIAQIPTAIVERQSLAVDAVSGATNTSKAILAAVEDCVTQAGGDVKALKAATAPDASAAKEAVEIETDVLVVGGGISGLAAAMTAADGGAKVTLIDKMPALGGTTAISGGYLISMGAERYKADAYENDNLDAFVSYWETRMAYSGAESGYPDWERLKGVLSETGATVDYLCDNDIPFAANVFTGFGPYPVAPCDGLGANLVATMQASAEKKGVTVMTGCKATSLVKDGDAVVGAMAETDAQAITFKAKSVVLCTGGISQNAELVAEHSPKIAAAQVIPISAVSNTGDGLVMALEAGAGTFDEFGTAICATTVDPAIAGAGLDGSTLTTNAQLGVNAKGERFASEVSIYYDALASDMIQNQNAPYSYIYDSANADIAAVLEAGATAGVVAKGETIAELAAAMGVDADALQATYAHYMELVKVGADAASLVALETAPFYAVKFYPTTFGSTGGVMTTDEGRVQQADGTVIPGLYAAGEMSNRYYYNENYILAASLGLYATMGRRAGNSAAADALK